MKTNNNYSKLFVISVVFSVLWIISCILSIMESIIVGLEIWYTPTFIFAVYSAISDLSASGNLWEATLTFFEALLALPLVVLFAGIIYIPIIVVVLVVYGVTFWIGAIYALVSIVLIIISLVFAILLLAFASKSRNKDLIDVKAMNKAKVFAIIGLASLLIAGAPNVISIISVLRYAFILVACITALIGVSRGIKACSEDKGETL